MEQHTLVKWLKGLVILAAACGAVVCAGLLPVLWNNWPALNLWMVWQGYLAWRIFVVLLGIPYFLALVFAWKIFTNIGKDRSFCMENANYMRNIAYLAAADTIFLLVGNVLFLLIGINHPGLLIACILLAFVGITVSVACAALSHLIQKAADLQLQSDLTI